MILHGDGSTNSFVKDGLLPFRFYVKDHAPNYLETTNDEPLYNDKEINGKFDIAVSNPPFSVDLDKQTQREIKNAFLFSERYYQLLKEGGRLSVVLPESVFDKTENKYIRLFLFKYFNIKAIVSLPQLTFEPFPSTKTSLLFAQKKTAQQVKSWNEKWNKFGKEWSLLKTRITDYDKYFVKGQKLNKKWAKDVVEDIEQKNNDNIKTNIKRFLKDYIMPEDNDLEIKSLLKNMLMKLKILSKYDKETDAFGFYNAWWVFGEVAKEMDYDIFMAEAENVGYKRTKRGENPMPNDLFDLEYAPNVLDTQTILSDYENNLSFNKKIQLELEDELAEVQTKNKEKSTKSLEKKAKKNIN